MKIKFFRLIMMVFLLLVFGLLVVKLIKGNNTDAYLLFDGVDDYLEVPDNDAYSVPTTGELTVSFWMRPDVLDFQTTIASGDGPYIDFLGKGEFLAPTNWEWNFRMYNNTGSARPNRVSFYIFNLGGGIGVGSYFQGGISGTPTMVAGEWIHVVGKIDNTNTSIYRNGVLKDTDNYTTPTTITPQNGAAKFRIGTVSTADFSPFMGAIDDVIIWNRALSDTEITNLYGGTIPETGVVGRWMFDEGVGNTATDDISANNGVLIPGSGHPEWVSPPIPTPTPDPTGYYPLNETLLNNTVSISGTTGDLQADDTSYRIIRSFPTSYTADFQTSSVDAHTTIGSTAYTDKTSLVWNVPTNGNYLIVANAGVGRSNTTGVRTTKAQMTINGTSYAETFAADDNDVDLFRPFSATEIQTLSAGTNTIKIQYAATNTSSNRGVIKNARIVAMRVDNTQMNTPADSTTTSTNYTNIATLTFTPKTTGDWLIIAHADITTNTAATLNYANLLIGSTQLAEHVGKVINNTHFIPFDAYDSVSLNANTSYTFKIQMKASSNTLTYKNVGLYAIPKSIFQATAEAEAIGETSCTTCTLSSPVTIATLNLNTGIGGTYLITATGSQGTGTTKAFSGVILKVGTTETKSVVDVGSTANYSSFLLQKIVSLDAGSTTVEVQLFSQTSGVTVKAKEVRINAIKLGAASGQKMEVEYTGIGNTLNWTKLDYLVNSGFSIASVGTSLQLWNYNSSTYPASGDGFLSYTSSATPNTFEDKTQSITTNSAYFRNSTTGDWKLKIMCTTSNGTWIDWSGDLLKYTPEAIANTAPVIPTLISPSNSAVGQSTTPTFQTVTTDANSDPLQYELKICTDSGMSANCQTFDQTSSNVGWSGQDVGTSAYSSGTTATYVLQVGNSLAENTTYYWKTRAKDYAGAGTWSSTQPTAYSFTTISNNISPSAPYLPFVDNTTAQSGQQTPVSGLIDHTPAFSAVFDDPDTSDTAASYQLQIGSDSDWVSAEIWDSTKTAVSGTCNENSRCADIVYSGVTSLVDGSTYYWRLKYWDNSDVGGSWSDTQQFSMNNAPSVSDITINGNNNINLSENSSIGISWIATVTDADSYTNLSSATGKIYRSGVGQSCTPNNNNCYTDTSCDFINCADDHCTALCSADLYFFTESTAIGSTYVDQYYQAWIEATDLQSEVGSSISTSTTVDVNNLSAFRIGSSLVYGEVFAGSDTGSSNTVVTVNNTGNSLINLEITGDYMCTDYPSCGGQSIEPHYQEYKLNTFTYGAGETLSLDPAIINIGISKPTQSPSNSFKNLYWGIGIPSLKVPGNYQGAVTILVD